MPLKFQKILVLVIFFLILSLGNVFAEKLPVDEIILKNGSVIYCNVIEKSKDNITIEAEGLGTITIPLSEINEIKKIKDIVKKWFPNPNDTRLFFAPTARPLKEKKGYFQDIYVFVASGNYGITDNFSVGGMFSLIPGIRVEQQVFAITPKYGIEINPDLHIAAGLLYGFGYQSIGHLGLAYGLGTFGSADSNITLGVGYGLNNVSSNTYSVAIGVLGGMYRITEYIALLSENWGIFAFNKGFIFLPSVGVRFFGDRLSADVGFVYPVMSGVSGFPNFVIPYVDFVFNF